MSVVHIKQEITTKEDGTKICIVNHKGEDYFLKNYKNEAKAEREYINQKFFYNLAQEHDTGFNFLEPKNTGDKIFYPALKEDFKWLAPGSSMEDELVELQGYLESMLEFFKFCQRRIDFEDLPEEIQHRYDQKGDQHYLDNFDKDSEYLEDQDLMSTAEKNNLRDVLVTNVDQRAFQHHDVVPWHMAKNKESGEIILVDAEWADWSLWAYDIAYYILQMVGYADQVEDAETVYKKVKQECSNKDNFDELLHCALVYRGTRLAAELHRAGKKKNLDKVVEITIKGRL
ncbi:MAG: hypothetical protein ABEJ24_04630 [Candidatus Magasanikbacteria bacterium]